MLFQLLLSHGLNVSCKYPVTCTFHSCVVMCSSEPAVLHGKQGSLLHRYIHMTLCHSTLNFIIPLSSKFCKVFPEFLMVCLCPQYPITSELSQGYLSYKNCLTFSFIFCLLPFNQTACPVMIFLSNPRFITFQEIFLSVLAIQVTRAAKTP